jgi:hypothetical protein
MIPRATKAGIPIAADYFTDHQKMIEEIVENPRWLAVMGAKAAADETRGIIRKYAKFIRWRDQKTGLFDLGLAQSLRRAGYVGSFQPVLPLVEETPWRRTARAFWPRDGGWMGGTGRFTVGDVPQAVVDAACIKTVSELFYHRPGLNRALLQGRLWQRTTPHVMVHLEPAPEQVRSIIIDASRLSMPVLMKRLRNATRSMIVAEKHELSFFVDKLLEKWVPRGFIASPAAAMISCTGSKRYILEGDGPLCTDANGVGINVCTGAVHNGQLVIEARADHRMWDAEQISKMWQFFGKRLPKVIEEGMA